MKTKLAVLDSGEGNDLQTILDACSTGQLNAIVVIVVSEAMESRALDRAEIAGVTAIYHPREWYLETGRSHDDYDASLADLIDPYQPDWIVLADWHETPGAAFMERYPNHVIDLHLNPGEVIDVLRDIAR
ncbi:MAG: formyltransferase family protein [Chloroflexota bacterium]